MTQIMFEKFNTPGFYLASQGVLSLYAYDLKTGVAIDSGAGITQIVPIYDGCTVKNGIRCLNFAGNNITDKLITIMSLIGYDPPEKVTIIVSKKEPTKTVREYIITNAYKATINDVKEKLGYVALDFEHETQTVQTSSLEKSYKASDGNEFLLRKEIFECAESLFQPSFWGSDGPGIHELTYNAILNCNPYFRKDLYANIVLSGGSTMFLGFKDRLQKEIINLAPNGMNVNVRDRLKEKNVTWIGGSKFASKTEFKSLMITKQDYEENGPNILISKCLL